MGDKSWREEAPLVGEKREEEQQSQVLLPSEKCKQQVNEREALL